MSDILNKAILQIVKRADKCDPNILTETFVNLGSLLPLLQGCDNHILYGRRGTGKTHILSYLHSVLEKEGECSIYIDLRVLGSTNSIYNNTELPIEQRAIRLIIDILQELHDSILRYITKNSDRKEEYLHNIYPLLESINLECNKIEIVGEVAKTNLTENCNSNNTSISISFKEGPKTGFDCDKKNKESESISQHGKVAKYMHFPAIRAIFEEILKSIYPCKIWIILDEYSEIPFDLQPYLADMLRRTLAPLRNLIIKIGSIEHRTELKLQIDSRQYLGLEIGADIYSCNLDDYMVFNNNEAQTLMFFRELLYKHINAILKDEDKYQNSDTMFSDLFTQEKAFEELVKAAEGVPRDAFNILSMAVNKDFYNKISVPNIRTAAKNWYNQDKESSVKAYTSARNLLNWVIDEVIGERHARAFLLRSDINSELIDFLYDSRVLHIIKQNVSSRDTPGVRYNVYCIDYGCYVDLINTTRNPKGLFEFEDENGNNEFCEVPRNDYRSIRRAVLNLDEFNNHHKNN